MPVAGKSTNRDETRQTGRRSGPSMASTSVVTPSRKCRTSATSPPRQAANPSWSTRQR